MTWIAFFLTMLFSASAIFVLAVLASSYRHAFAAYGDIRRALESCETKRIFTIRTFDAWANPSSAVREPKLRLASSNLRPAPSCPSLRAAA